MPQNNTKPVKRYAITLEYDGAGFAGFQLQQNAKTVQSVLEGAVRKRFREKRRVAGASRTDAGVHARGQVAVFDLEHPIPVIKLTAAMNSALPPAVRVLKARRVPQAWEPRPATQYKTYTYLIYNRKITSPLWQARAWQIFTRLDISAMRRAAGHLVGKHDFTSFRASGCVAKDPVRNLRVLKITQQGYLIKFRFTADAFLYHMVRNLVGTLVEVGKGRLAPAKMKPILQAKNRKLSGPTAPAHGLYLDRIKF